MGRGALLVFMALLVAEAASLPYEDYPDDDYPDEYPEEPDTGDYGYDGLDLGEEEDKEEEEPLSFTCSTVHQAISIGDTVRLPCTVNRWENIHVWS